MSRPEQNRLLDALSQEEQLRLFPELEAVTMCAGDTIYAPDTTIDYVYFPTTSIVALLHITENGASAEIALVGNEGLVGVSLFMGGETTSSWAVVQSTGKGYRLPAKRLKQEFVKGGRLQNLLLRYTQALLTQMAQTAVCNRHHTVDQQLCRWLLLSLDRLPSNQLSITQGSIANMLGVRREGVTEAAGNLQRAGLIHYSRGKIEVLDRIGLEARVCECYQVVKREADRLLPPLCRNSVPVRKTARQSRVGGPFREAMLPQALTTLLNPTEAPV
ncbi:MAG: Crp/Fnr family transcriptional regulator [Spongiibacteraceae bacterium]|nr:Crp/Fnr family transcriptional regulator [Spongiibacteraceae bacterium]